MKIHLAWIRMTAAAALAAGVGVHPAAAQYAPYRPIPQQPTAPQAAPAATAPATPYGAYRNMAPPAPYQIPTARYQAPAATYQAPTTTYQAPAAAAYPAPAARAAPYQAPAAPPAPVAPAAPAYRQPTAQPPVAYPQTAMAQYPAVYGGTPYVARQQPTETLPPPSEPSAQSTESIAAPVEQTAPMPAGAPAPSGYPAAGCGCNGSGDSYTAAGCNSCGSYPDLSGYMNDCGNGNMWFGGVYFLYMERDEPSNQQLAVQVDNGASYPYYPPHSTTVVSTVDADYDFRPGVEVRFGSTFTVGESCNTGCGSGYGYNGCGTGCGGRNSCCAAPTMYAWEFAWWGLANDDNWFVVQDDANTRLYGMKSFAGLEYDRDGAGGTYTYAPVNNYYDYQMPIQTPGTPPYVVSLAQRVWTDFKAQNLELNIIRFPVCDTGCGGCGNCGTGCGSDACGCTSGCNTGCNSGCDDSWCSNFSMYGSCGVRYFRTDDDFSYDSEFATFDGTTYDHTYDGFSGIPDLFELCYDINIENNLIGPQVGWTTNYCVGCRWNFFCNSTFGVFDNHMTQEQRLWGSGDVRFVNSGESMLVRSKKDDVAFLGELRLGGSYDFNCNWRGVLAYRAIGLSGIATSVGQIPDNFSDRADVAQINSDNSMIIHGLQTGVECRY
jgi:hypothetical protein